MPQTMYSGGMKKQTLLSIGSATLFLGSLTPGCGGPIAQDEADAPQVVGQREGAIVGVPGSCPLFPSDNPWNQDISKAPVDPNSAAYIASMNGATKFLHPDFGSDPSYGIP